VYQKTDWAIAHRGACLQFPEHNKEAYEAAMKMGSGIVECDVIFTGDLELTCRHSQCDLHYATDIVTRPELNKKCSIPFVLGSMDQPLCCPSDFILEEIMSLCAIMESARMTQPLDGTTEDYVFGGTPRWRNDLFATPGVTCPKAMTHKESFILIDNYRTEGTLGGYALYFFRWQNVHGG
jgi:glycerophosphoryl diester phosphodiesterase